MNKWVEEELVTSCKEQGYDLVDMCNNYNMLLMIQNKEVTPKSQEANKK